MQSVHICNCSEHAMQHKNWQCFCICQQRP